MGAVLSAFPALALAGGTITGNLTVNGFTAIGTNLAVGTATLGDNGVGEIQLANAITPPTTNPVGGGVLYNVNGAPYVRDPNGTVSGLVSGPDTSHPTAGALAETVHLYTTSTAAAPTSGTLYLQSIFLSAGTTVSKIGFVTSTTAATGPTHWWVALLDQTYTQQAHSADQTAAAITASTWTSLAMVTPFTPKYTGRFYLAFMIATSTTQPTLAQATNAPLAALITGTGAPTPLHNGASTAALTTPGTDGTTVYAAPTAASAPFYLYCS